MDIMRQKINFTNYNVNILKAQMRNVCYNNIKLKQKL